MKLDSTRIKETISYISNNANLDAQLRGPVAQFCRATFPKLSAFDFGPYRTEFETVAESLSVKQNVTVAAGTKDERKKRRAIALIWVAMNKVNTGGVGTPPPALAAAMGMPAGNLDAALTDAVLKAAVCASPASAQIVFTTQVVAHPLPFITAHKVFVKGSPAGGAKFTAVNGPDYSNVLNFYFQFDCGRNRFVFNAAANALLGASHRFATVSVPAVNWYDVPGNGGEAAPVQPGNFAQILGCELTGADFMVTTQFTGCTFSWTDFGGVIRASHVGPTKAGYPAANLATSYAGGGNGVATRMINQLAPAAGMANAPGALLRVFGRGAGNAPAVAGGNPYYPNAALEYATIIGRRKNAAWKFYLQVVDPTGALAEHRRIF